MLIINIIRSNNGSEYTEIKKKYRNTGNEIIFEAKTA